MKRIIILLPLLLLSFDWGFTRDLWKPVNTALGWYYAMQDHEYHDIAWDLLTDDWKYYQDLDRDTFAEDFQGGKLVDVSAGVFYPPDYYHVILVFDDYSGILLCVRNDKGHWEIDCVWSE